MDLRGLDTPAREPAMPIFSIKLRPARIEELNELAELYNCNRADIVPLLHLRRNPTAAADAGGPRAADLSTTAKKHPPVGLLRHAGGHQMRRAIHGKYRHRRDQQQHPETSSPSPQKQPRRLLFDPDTSEVLRQEEWEQAQEGSTHSSAGSADAGPDSPPAANLVSFDDLHLYLRPEPKFSTDRERLTHYFPNRLASGFSAGRMRPHALPAERPLAGDRHALPAGPGGR